MRLPRVARRAIVNGVEAAKGDPAAVLAPLRGAGRRAYLGEPVTVLAHSLQAAVLAEGEGHGPELVVAALLHDIGWLVRGGPREHEVRGACELRRHFGPAVVEPVRLHVEAKRFLTSTEAGYRTLLSDASKRTMALQGGPMGDEEVEAFLAEEHAEAAVALRRIDDRAKDPFAATPPLDLYEPLVASLLLAG